MKPEERITLEQTVISSILKNEDQFTEVLRFTENKEIFIVPENTSLFKCAVEYYYDNGKVPGIRDMNMHLTLRKNGCSLKKYLKEQIINAEYTFKALDCMKILLDDNIGHELNNVIKATGGPGFDRAIALNEALSGIITRYTSDYSRVLTNAEAAKMVYDNIVKTVNGDHSDYIPTGFQTLDRDIIGFPKKELTIIASRPGMGKSQFMVSLVRNFIKQGVKCGVFSLEMNLESLWHRLLAEETGIDALKIERGSLSKLELAKIRRAVGELSKDDFIIDDNGHQTPESIKAEISLWKTRNSVGVVMVDYLTLIDYSCDERRNDLNIGKMTKNLREFAKKTGIPIILLSQLNRAVESRNDKRPQLSDIRESGDIEQDASVVMFIYRPDYYGVDPYKDTKERYITQDGFMLEAREYAEIIIRKARSGVVGVHPMRCILSLQRFEEVTSAYPEADVPGSSSGE